MSNHLNINKLFSQADKMTTQRSTTSRSTRPIQSLFNLNTSNAPVADKATDQTLNTGNGSIDLAQANAGTAGPGGNSGVSGPSGGGCSCGGGCAGGCGCGCSGGGDKAGEQSSADAASAQGDADWSAAGGDQVAQEARQDEPALV